MENVVKVNPDIPRIVIQEDEYEAIRNSIEPIIRRKAQEEHHKIDGGSEEKRWMTGKGGEVAVEKLIRRKFVDWDVCESSLKKEADLLPLGVNVGIKTVTLENGFHIIHIDVKRPEIMVLEMEPRTYLILGLAFRETLRAHRDPLSVLSSKLLARGDKTAFNGYKYLRVFKNFDELVALVKEDESQGAGAIAN